MKKSSIEQIKETLAPFQLNEDQIKSIYRLHSEYNVEVYDAYRKVKDSKNIEELNKLAEQYLDVQTSRDVMKSNHKAAKAIKNQDLKKIWDFLIRPENINNSYSAKQISGLLPQDLPEEIVSKRLSDLKTAGLVKVTGYDSYLNRAGHSTKFGLFRAVCNDSFDKIAPRLKKDIRAKDLKVNTVMKQSFLFLSDKLRDRALPQDLRYQIIGDFVQGLNSIVNINTETDDLKNRYKSLPGTYDMLTDFLRKYDDEDNRLEIEITTEDLDDVEDLDYEPEDLF